MDPIWYILGIAPLAVAFIGVALNRGDKIVGRFAFLVRLFVLATFGFVVPLLTKRDDNIQAAALVLYIVATWIVIPYWSVSRLRDMGIHHRYVAALTMVPLLGWAFIVYLLFAKSESAYTMAPTVGLSVAESADAPRRNSDERVVDTVDLDESRFAGLFKRG